MLVMHALQAFLLLALFTLPVCASLRLLSLDPQMVGHISQSPLIRLTSQVVHGLDPFHGLSELTIKRLHACF